MSFKPQRRTLLVLAMRARDDAKQTDNKYMKEFYWEMAFEYLTCYRKHYGGGIL
jgi:hypothetical protein